MSTKMFSINFDNSINISTSKVFIIYLNWMIKAFHINNIILA